MAKEIGKTVFICSYPQCSNCLFSDQVNPLVPAIVSQHKCRISYLSPRKGDTLTTSIEREE